MQLKKLMLAGAAAAALSFAGWAATADAATDTFTVDAVIVNAISVACGTNMNFGTLDAAVADTITVSTAGALTEAAGTENIIDDTAASNAVCDIDGDDLAVDVVLTNDPQVITEPGSGDTMNVANWTMDCSTGCVIGGTEPNFTTTLTGGFGVVDTLQIGADLTIVGGESAGTYTGTQTLEVTYQ